FFMCFIIIGIDKVEAKEITIDNVISFMKNNNIFDDSDYFYMFGKMLNGNNAYNIKSFKYKIEKEDNNIIIKATLTDAKVGNIETTTTLAIKDNLINYVNTNDIDSLESRIDTIIFSQIVYSIGGARGYDKDILINWLNQIDLNTVTANDGIECDFENVKYSIENNGRTYEYEVSVPKSYIIDINKVTEKMPNDYNVEIKDIKPGITEISMTVYAKNHLDEMCEIYRKNDKNNFELVGKVSCNNGRFMDINLKDETTYYYQTIIEDKIMCSEEIEITTFKAPATGFLPSIGSLLVLVTLGIIVHKTNKKFNLFKRI
ncbi:MAG: hypothetical protein K2J20_04120, partial [Bacilli bacterium]|nr:hypothetical protein [Bacilli bacterium]